MEICSDEYGYTEMYVSLYLSVACRYAEISLDSILKSRDITLPTKVHLVKVMFFPVVTYECENWTIKMAEPKN